MKYFKYLSFTFLLLFYTNNVFAADLSSDNFKMSLSNSFYNCKSNNNCSDVIGSSWNGSVGGEGVYSSSSKITTVANSYGAAIYLTLNDEMVKDNYYTVSFGIVSETGVNIEPFTAHTNFKVGMGTTSVLATDVSLDYQCGNIYRYHTSTGGSVVMPNACVLSYTFKSPSNGSDILLPFTTNKTVTEYFYYLGYNFISHGFKAPSADDIKNSLSSSFNNINDNISNVQNSINNNINSVENSINNNINDMKENIDNTLNSEDNDVTSSKCGIVCKLKNIVVSIIDLPVKIWEKLKVGFELITGAIGDFCDSIINIFLPEPECTKSPNLITYDLNYQFGPNSITYEVLDDGGIKFNGVCGTLGVTTTANCTFRFNLEESNFDGTLSFYANKKVQGGYISAGNISINMAVSTLGSYLTGSSYGTINRSFYDIILNAGYDYTDLVIYPQVEKENVNNNNKTDNSWFTKPGEVCTEASFFSWFERFGQIIKGFFDTLLGGILDGLKSLFVPTDEQLLDIIDKSKELSENFGFVGQSVNFFLNIFTSLLGLVNANGCVQLPEMTIGETSLFDSHTFWNSQLVCLNDNKILADNIETIRTITSIALVCMFVNFASRKFFEVLSKNETPEQSQSVGGVYR